MWGKIFSKLFVEEKKYCFITIFYPPRAGVYGSGGWSSFKAGVWKRLGGRPRPRFFGQFYLFNKGMRQVKSIATYSKMIEVFKKIGQAMYAGIQDNVQLCLTQLWKKLQKEGSQITIESSKAVHCLECLRTWPDHLFFFWKLQSFLHTLLCFWPVAYPYWTNKKGKKKNTWSWWWWSTPTGNWREHLAYVFPLPR